MSETETQAKPKEAKALPLQAPPAAAARKRVRPLQENDFGREAYITMPTTSATPDAGVQLADVLEPDYWANVRGRYAEFGPGARVLVMPKDRAWWAELLVVDVGAGFARVVVIKHIELDPAAAVPLVPPGYDINPLANGKYRAVRLARYGQPAVILNTACRSFEDALREVREDLMKLRAA